MDFSSVYSVQTEITVLTVRRQGLFLAAGPLVSAGLGTRFDGGLDLS
jgi:hypothetical protein